MLTHWARAPGRRQMASKNPAIFKKRPARALQFDPFQSSGRYSVVAQRMHRERSRQVTLHFKYQAFP